MESNLLCLVSLCLELQPQWVTAFKLSWTPNLLEQLTMTFLLPSPRSGQMYYMFGFIMLAFVVLVVVCMQTSVLLCYFHLCAEDYRWWWRSFFSTGTTALYLSLFSLHYFTYKTSITGALSYLLYFGYTFIMVFLFFIMTGKLDTTQ